MTRATITALHVYPIKSCRGITLSQASLETTGFHGDRRWMVVNESGRYVTQRQLPRLALIVPEITQHGLSLAAPGMPALHVSEPIGGSAIEVTIVFDRFAALDAGPEAAEWLSRFLGQPVRLVRFDARVTRPIHPQFWSGAFEAGAEFADAFPLLIISQASLSDLNTRLDTPLPMNRFRPNVVVDGLAPYDEDRIHELADGALRLQMARPCTRCKITTNDQLTGEVAGVEPLATLKSYRWNKDLPGIMFGHYAVVASGVGAQLQVGQRLEIMWK